ncbi:hypothetical protein, partial [Caenispirillum bisanense]|uniref:hypothetical protein n=1 Tax=Caenispirillum bisanense TaxID=414052 RepID=UPI0031D90CEB
MKRLVLILLASTCLSAPLLAQSTPADPAAPAAGDPAAPTQPGAADATQPGTAQPGAAGTPAEADALVVQKVPMLTLPKVSVEVPEGEPIPLDMTLKAVPGAEPKLLEGVTAKAFTRYVTVEGDRIGQLVLTAVTKDEKIEALPHELFVSQFEIKAAPVLPTAEEVTVEGDQETMIAALMRLQEEDEKEEEDKKKDEKDGRDSKDGRDGKSGSGTSSNPDAAGYKTPDRLQQAKGDGKEFDPGPLPEVAIITDGCPIRIDRSQGVAIQQSRVVITTGATTETEPCEDGATRYPLLWSSLTCPDRIDVRARTATAQRRQFYVNAAGQEVEVKRCEDNPEQIFPIEEERTVCPHFVDHDRMTVVEQGSLRYRNAENATIVVRDCAPAEGATPVPLVETAEGCTLRHDFAAGRSNRQTKLVYRMGGLTYQAGSCIDSDTWYQHLRLYETAAGQQVCPPVVDTTGKRITRASRVQITVDGKPEFITECQPDTASSALIATTDGCENPGTWEHNISAGQSTGQERYYYTRANGQREYVTACQNSSVTYPHQIQIVG